MEEGKQTPISLYSLAPFGPEFSKKLVSQKVSTKNEQHIDILSPEFISLKGIP